MKACEGLGKSSVGALTTDVVFSDREEYDSLEQKSI